MAAKLTEGLEFIELANLAASLMGLFRRGGTHGEQASGAPYERSFLVTLVELIVRVWEEKGGSMKDESEMLESLFSNPDPNSKSTKLLPEEHRKVSSVIKAMTPAERKVFRIALFLMDPEVSTIETPGTPPKKDADGKVIKEGTKPTVRTERTGVDPRINVLRGIAEHVHEDLSNAAEVAAMLRDTGALGANNEALSFLQKVQMEIKKLLCKLLGVASIEDITTSLVIERLTGEIQDLAPVPMGPIEYLINSVMIGGDKAELVLIPRWIKNFTIKWPWSIQKPRRTPLEYHERKTPTL
jgi:hypothetical protein